MAGGIIPADRELDNADWTKRTWDVDLPKPGTPEFDAMLKSRGMTLEQFKRLPVYQHALAAATIKE